MITYVPIVSFSVLDWQPSQFQEHKFLLRDYTGKLSMGKYSLKATITQSCDHERHFLQKRLTL